MNIAQLRGAITRALSSIQSSIGDMRKQIAEARQSLKQAQNAPLPLADVRASVKVAVSRRGSKWLSEHGPYLLSTGRSSHQRAVAQYKPDAKIISLPDGVSDVFGLMCASDPEAAERLILGALAPLDYTAGVAAADRASLISKLERELSTLEDAEIAAVDAAINDGVVIEHRREVVQARAAAEAAAKAEADRAEAIEAHRRQHGRMPQHVGHYDVSGR